MNIEKSGRRWMVSKWLDPHTTSESCNRVLYGYIGIAKFPHVSREIHREFVCGER